LSAQETHEARKKLQLDEIEKLCAAFRNSTLQPDEVVGFQALTGDLGFANCNKTEASRHAYLTQ
jgi:hypothetical protein